jgi:hypothetical protein
MNEYSGNFDLNSVSSLPRWFGRVVSSASWQDNIEAAHFDPKDQKGWGYRYRVRYFGLHTGNTQDLPDDQLPMANVILPVTAGSGLGGFIDTPALSAGTVVTGIFLDGMAGQQPYIDGVLINSNNEVPKQQPKDEIGGLQLFNDTYSGTSPQTASYVPDHLIATKKIERPSNVSTEYRIPQEGQAVIQSAIDKSRSVDFDKITKFAFSYKEDISKVYSVASPCKSDNGDMKGIQLTIKNLQNSLSTILRFSNINSAVGALINENVEPGKTIKKIIDIASSDIGGYVKNIMSGVRGWTLNKVQDEAKKMLPFLFPGEMPAFINKLNEGTNLLSCVFAKITRGLSGLVGNLLLGFIDKFINGPMGLIEEFVGKLLDQILGPIQTAITTINLLLGGITGAIAGIAGSLFNMLDFATGILNFFKCDDDKACPTQSEITRAGAGVNNNAGGDPQGSPAGGTSSPSDGAATANSFTSGQGNSIGASDPINYKVANSSSVDGTFGTSSEATTLLGGGSVDGTTFELQ